MHLYVLAIALEVVTDVDQRAFSMSPIDRRHDVHYIFFAY